MIVDIADKMLDAIIYDNDIRLPDGDYDVWREKLTRLLWPAYDRLGEVFFTNELIADFCMGEYTEMNKIIEEYPVLRPVHDLLNEFFEEAGDYDMFANIGTKMDVGDQDAYDRWVKEANMNIDEYLPKDLDELKVDEI